MKKLNRDEMMDYVENVLYKKGYDTSINGGYISIEKKGYTDSISIYNHLEEMNEKLEFGKLYFRKYIQELIDEGKKAEL